MSSVNHDLTASELPIALFSLGLPLTLAAFSLSGIVAPANLAEMMVTGLAILGLLAEMIRDDRKSVAPFWFKAGIPCLIISWISFNCFPPLVQPFLNTIPFMMEIRPLLYLLITALWLTIFPPPKPRHIYFWSAWLAVLICAEFIFRFFWQGLSVAPHLFGTYSLTGPVLLVGLCATLHKPETNRLSRGLILAGIFCSLNRDIALTAVMVLLIAGPKGLGKKITLVILLLAFDYLSLAPQEMTLLNRNDLPAYWLWFSSLELFANHPELFLTGMQLTVPLPFNIPASLWNIWHEQQLPWSNSGIYLFHIAPFWLHILTAWGLGGICIAATAATVLCRRHSSDMMTGLIIAMAVSGFFSPLLYAPASAIVLICSFMSAVRPEVQSFKFE